MRYFAALIALIAFFSPARAHAQSPYEVLKNAYAPYMDGSDKLAFPVKVRALTQNPYTFWRGSKDLFFIWAKENCAEWFKDPATFIPGHGDLHLGNIGSYAADGEFGSLAVGMVDFDDADELPFQVDVLQGLITLGLVIDQQELGLSAEDEAKVMQTAIDAYVSAVKSDATVGELLADSAMVKRLLKDAHTPYEAQLEKYVGADGKLIAGPLKQDIMRPAGEMVDDVAGVLAAAVAECPSLARVFRYKSVEEFRGAILDVSQRTRLGSSGSQGLRKYFVLMESPLVGIEGPMIVYLKEEIPSAAERAGDVPRDERRPGRRVAEMMGAINQPLPYVSGWCELGGRSYWVTFKEPWGNELEAKDIKSLDELMEAARIWGTVAGGTPGHRAKREFILTALTGELVGELNRLAAVYVEKNLGDFNAFREDPEVTRAIREAEKALMAMQ